MTGNRFHWDWKSGRMKDTYSNFQATKDMRLIERQINDACHSYEKQIAKLEKENVQLKSRINDLEWILGIRSDITSVYCGDRNFNCCILDLIGNGKQQGVLNYLYNHYRKNDYEIKRFDNILREHKVKYGKYGWEKER